MTRVSHLLLGVVLAMSCRDKSSSTPPKPTTSQTSVQAKTSKAGGVVAGNEAFDGWTAEPTAEGTVTVRNEHMTLVRMRPVAFGPGFAWANPHVTDAGGSDNVRNFELAVQGLALRGTATVKAVDDRTVEVTWNLDVAKPMQDISGVGLDFQLALDAPAWPGGKPELRDDGKGFSIPVEGGQSVEVVLQGESARLFFERNDPSRPRAWFLEGDVEAGSQQVTMTVRLPKGGKVLPPVMDRYGAEDPSTWPSATVTWNDWPVDVSFLSKGDRPAGKHGRVQAKGDALVFEDGTPARFWGTNVAAQSLFVGAPKDVCVQAERLSALGFNLVRLHHHDSHWVGNNVFVRGSNDTKTLDPKAIERLDWWIHCLREQGIYVWIDLHVGRRFRPGDAIDGGSELAAAQQGEAKGFNYVNPTVEAAMQRFAEQYLRHENPHTKKTWATDPAVLGVLVTNENDLGDHFGGLLMPDKDHKWHRKRFESLAKEIVGKLGLPEREALQAWRPGAGKILLAEIQHRFDARAIEHLRSLGVKAPIATTSYWGRNNWWALAPLVGGDLIDVHSYGEPGALRTNPRADSNWIHFIAGAQVAGMPLTVTEWNVPAPARDRFSAPLYVASIGALQGWDALMLYAYNQHPVEQPRRTNKWSAWIDPALIALSPAAAVMYRRGDVAGARKTFVLKPSKDDVFGARRNAESSAAIRTLAEQSRLLVQLPEVEGLPWLQHPDPPEDAEVVTDLDRDFLSPKARSVTSDTGEITRDFALGIQIIDTPRSQATTGWLGGRRIETSDVVFELDTPQAAVALTSLDDEPIATSKSILVTVVARSIDHQGRWAAEPVAGSLAVRTNLPALELTPLASNSRAPSAALSRGGVSGAKEDDLLRFELPTELATHWFLLRPPTAGSETRK